MELQNRLQELDRLVSGKEALKRERQQKYQELAAEVLKLTSEEDLLGKVDEVLLLVSGKVLGQSIQTVDKLVTAGLRIVFDDQHLEFTTKVDKMRGKTSVLFDLKQDGRSVPILESYGGGVLVIAGVLLRVATILVLNLRRVLFLDETLSHLSKVYVPNASKLLKRLCSELDFTILMVTHEEQFALSADRHYEAKAGKAGTTFQLK